MLAQKNSFEFKFLFSENPSLKQASFGSNFENQLIDHRHFNVYYARCSELLQVRIVYKSDDAFLFDF